MQSEITLKLAVSKMQEREATLVLGIKKLEKLVEQAESELNWDTVDNFKKRLLALKNERLSLQKSLAVYQSTLHDFQVSRSPRLDIEFSPRQDPKPSIKKEVVNLEYTYSPSSASDIIKNNIQIKSINQNTIKLLTEIENDMKIIQDTSKILIDKVLQCKLQIQESSRLNELLDKKMQVDLEIDTELEDLRKAMEML